MCLEFGIPLVVTKLSLNMHQERSWTQNCLEWHGVNRTPAIRL
jgi:hypothetical protein